MHRLCVLIERVALSDCCFVWRRARTKSVMHGRQGWQHPNAWPWFLFSGDVSNSLETAMHTARWVASNLGNIRCNSPVVSVAIWVQPTKAIGRHPTPMHPSSKAPCTRYRICTKWWKALEMHRLCVLIERVALSDCCFVWRRARTKSVMHGRQGWQHPNAWPWFLFSGDVSNSLETAMHTARWVASNLGNIRCNSPVVSVAIWVRPTKAIGRHPTPMHPSSKAPCTR